MSTDQIIDITIIGGGPTGLAAAYYGGHRDASVRIVESLEQLGGQVSAVYPEKHIFDVAGFPKVNGQELIDRLIEQAGSTRPRCVWARWWSAVEHRDDEVIELHTADGETLLTRTMIITAGHGAFNPRTLGAARAGDVRGQRPALLRQGEGRLHAASGWRWWAAATRRWTGR